MKAYFNMAGFTRMADIPTKTPTFVFAMPNTIGMMIDNNERREPRLDVLTFNLKGELRGANETILQYEWDGVLPTRKGRVDE